MKRYFQCKNKRAVNGAYNSPYRVRNRNKEKPNYGSAYFKVSLERPAEDKQIGPRVWNKITIPQIKYDNYIVELDNHRDAPAHFHVWRADGFQKVSGTRSPAINLKTSINNGLVVSYREQKREAKLNDIQSAEIINFVEENRFLLYLMFMAHKTGKVKQFASTDEEYIASLFSDHELAALADKFKKTIENQPVYSSEYEK